MAIYTRKDLFKQDNIKVRFYKYFNIEVGLGEATTVFYATFPVKAFNRNNLVFQSDVKLYDLKPKYDNKIKKILGDDWRKRYAFEEMDMRVFKNEVEKAKEVLEIANNRRHFA